MRDSYRISQFFNNDRQLFLIPLYQRKYAWEIKHCKRLFLDLEKIIANNIKSHFFGSIVYMQASQHYDDLLIIDGQQRITTISLLVLAAINSVKNGIMENDEDDRYLEKISEKYLLAPYRHGVDRKIKLRPIESDMKAYDALFGNDETQFVPSEQSGITRNYMLFYELLKLSSSLNLRQLIEAIERLVIIEIRLDSDDNPQLIFESLNSCGKDLEEADKVRNYLLMSLTNEEQEGYFKKYWSKIEEYTDDQPTMFIRDYLMMKARCIKNISELYFEFKSFDEKTNMSREELLADMTKFAKYHMQILKAKTGNTRLDRKLWQLSNINSTVPMPFELAFMEYADNHDMTFEEKFAVFDVIENFWARRIICNKPANVLNKLYITLHSEVLRIIQEHEDRNIPLTVGYAELLKYVLLRKKGNTSVPTDKEIEEWFPLRYIYKMPIDYKCFMFERMENADNIEGDKSIVQRLKDKILSIEHIMPQTLTTQWKSDLGNNWQEIYDSHLHTFANLTLTGYNTSYSNHSFIDKKNGYIDRKGNTVYGFKDSPLYLNSYLKTCDKWTLNEMNERQHILLERFIHLWPMITTTYTPLEKETETVVFGDDDIELTGRDIMAFSYKGKRQTVSSWKDMLVQLCTMIYEESKTDMGYVATLNWWLHTTPQKGRVRIGEHCYVPCNNSTSTKQSIIAYLFSKLNIPEPSLEYELKPLLEDTIIDAENGDEVE